MVAALMRSTALRCQFAHGLEGSPQGKKAQALGRHFTLHAPAMNTADFEACVALHALGVEQFRPHVLVGSSFGGAVAVALLQRGLWRGPTLLLAPATRRYLQHNRLVTGVAVTIVHGRSDTVIALADSEALAATGASPETTLLIREDDHALQRFVASGELITCVQQLAAPYNGPR